MSVHPSAGDRLTKRRYRDLADALARTNGEPSCKEHRMATVAVLEGIDEVLDELQAGTARFLRLEVSIEGLKECYSHAKELQYGQIDTELTTEGLVRAVLKQLPARSITGSSSTGVWVCIAACVLSICATAVYIVHRF